jgi:ABC-type multidrug transport system ATPase subunit
VPRALLCTARVLPVRPQGRFTLLLGPPGSGKSTLLKALSNKLDRGTLRVDGDITYNGHRCLATFGAVS